MNIRIQTYINQFNDLFSNNLWLDESFRKKLDHITPQQAFTQAPGNNHSVAEVVSHLVVWRREITRKLVENSPERRLTDDSPENWLPLQVLQQKGWDQLYTELKESHQQFVDFLSTRQDAFLDAQHANTHWNNEYFVAGLLHHDIYHLGQIGLILKWAV